MTDAKLILFIFSFSHKFNTSSHEWIRQASALIPKKCMGSWRVCLAKEKAEPSRRLQEEARRKAALDKQEEQKRKLMQSLQQIKDESQGFLEIH